MENKPNLTNYVILSKKIIFSLVEFHKHHRAYDNNQY